MEENRPEPPPEWQEPPRQEPDREEIEKQMEAAIPPEGASTELEVGHRLKGKLVQIGEKESFLDYGGRSEAIILSQELRDEKGEIKFAVGDSLEATIESVDEQVVLTLGKKSGPTDRDAIRAAYEGKVPVEGTVKSTNKGGFEVAIGSLRAFCPFSQIDIAYCADPNVFVGQKLSFLITRFDGGGRNVVVSRRVILEEERKAMVKETEERLKEGEVFEGMIRRVLPFGAFVDIGGIEGLLHVSELSHAHIGDPKEVLQPGQVVKVQVIGVEQKEKGRRISLSMKALEPDPWAIAIAELEPGKVVRGKVARLTDFGAFVELAPGVDGLLHISEISMQRIKHPQDVLSPDEEIEVKILDIDPAKKRISLSRKSLEKQAVQQEEKAKLAEFKQQQKKKKEDTRPKPEDLPPPPTESMETLLDRLQDKFRDNSLD
ncbi:MAG: S1 RNA-binding domain-containing protein [Candidatus Eisenbacteria bacterium]|nr:S1 RNA-binding domain-containing protein [Candidatus Eisenbacteria bacterium]